MKRNEREARWLKAYQLQKDLYEAKKARKEQNLKSEIAALEQKQVELEARRQKLEEELRKLAQETFRSFEDFSTQIVQQSENSKKSTPDD